MWATLGSMLLAIYAVQAFGQVILRDASTAQPDQLFQAMNGPRGLWVRAGVLLLIVLLILLGLGAFEPSTLADRLLRLMNAA